MAPETTAVNQVWVADITCIQTAERWIYLAGVLDLCSHKIVGLAMTEWINTTLRLEALSMARTHRQPHPNPLFRIDRGV